MQIDHVKKLKEDIINKIINIEGGYVNDKNDSGGETTFGVTKNTARRYGYKGRMIDLSRDIAFEIYESMYLKPIMFEQIARQSLSIAEELADTAVNMGVSRSGKMLQRSLNALNNGGKYYNDIKTDGVIGEATLRALVSYLSKRGKVGEVVLLRALNGLQVSFYINLVERRRKDERFLFGWLKNRVV